MTKRKGSRSIVVDNQEYSWYRGKVSTEIRNLATNKAVLIHNQNLERKIIIDQCVCGPECCPVEYGEATTPSAIAEWIQNNNL
jgi:hypothetical protein